MGKCAVCSKSEVSLLYANHKELGVIEMCRDCWRDAYMKNLLVYRSDTPGGCCGQSQD
ncbi:MAG: hypothetical protein QXO01_07310 [Nitrososphaerota archaeon]